MEFHTLQVDELRPVRMDKNNFSQRWLLGKFGKIVLEFQCFYNFKIILNEFIQYYFLNSFLFQLHPINMFSIFVYFFSFFFCNQKPSLEAPSQTRPHDAWSRYLPPHCLSCTGWQFFGSAALQYNLDEPYEMVETNHEKVHGT